MVSLNFPGFSQIYFNVMQISEVKHTYYRYNTTTDIQQAEWFWIQSVNIIKFFRYAKSFINLPFFETKLFLGPGFYSKYVVCKWRTNNKEHCVKITIRELKYFRILNWVVYYAVYSWYSGVEIGVWALCCNGRQHSYSDTNPILQKAGTPHVPSVCSYKAVITATSQCGPQHREA